MAKKRPNRKAPEHRGNWLSERGKRPSKTRSGSIQDAIDRRSKRAAPKRKK